MIDSSIPGIETEIEIAAPPERVWQAWTQGDEFVSWWGEDQLYRVTDWTGDVRLGGKWRSEGKHADGKPFHVEGEYLVVAPPHLLTFTWRPSWLGADSNTIVSLELQKTLGGTRLKLLHHGFGQAETRNSHADGWNRVLGWLRNYLESENQS